MLPNWQKRSLYNDNDADWNSDSVQSSKCLEVAGKHNKPVIVMEPVKGGLLANPPKAATDILDSLEAKASYPGWALRFAASQDNIITVLSGMSTIAQMEDNLATMSDFKPLDNQEMEAAMRAGEALAALPSIPCTGCRYCVKDCPVGIAIPDCFDQMNRYLVYDDLAGARGGYKGWVTNVLGAPASTCLQCGQCEAVCPQQIEIMEELTRLAEILGSVGE